MCVHACTLYVEGTLGQRKRVCTYVLCADASFCKSIMDDKLFVQICTYAQTLTCTQIPCAFNNCWLVCAAGAMSNSSPPSSNDNMMMPNKDDNRRLVDTTAAEPDGVLLAILDGRCPINYMMMFVNDVRIALAMC